MTKDPKKTLSRKNCESIMILNFIAECLMFLLRFFLGVIGLVILSSAIAFMFSVIFGFIVIIFC